MQPRDKAHRMAANAEALVAISGMLPPPRQAVEFITQSIVRFNKNRT